MQITPQTPVFGQWQVRQFLFIAFFISIGLSFNSCTPKMAPFNSEAFESGKLVTTKALDLINLGTKPYSENESVVNSFMKSYNNHLSIEKGRGENNMKTVEMWELLMNSDENLLGGFIQKWKTDGSLSQVFVTQAKSTIGDNMKKILNLESKKKKK